MTRIENTKFPQYYYYNFPAEEKEDKKVSAKSLLNSDLLQKTLAGAGFAGLAIVAIYQRNKISRLSRQLGAQKNVYSNTPPAEQLIPYKILDFQKTELFKPFQKSKNGFIQFLSSLNSEPSKVKEFLFAITADKKMSFDFIKEVIADPRKSAYNLKILRDKIGGNKNLMQWLQAPKGYNEAYTRYITEITREADSNSSYHDMLLKISPNWHVHILRNGADSFNIGKLPKVFEELGDFNHFAEWMNMHVFKIGEPETLEYSGKYMEVTVLNNGRSGKIPYKIKFLNTDDNKEYVLKVQQRWGCNTPYARECLAYRSDSTCMDAQIDYYLSLNNCENIPKMYYYDYGSNAALYEFLTGAHPKGLNNPLTANSRLTDLNSLGIYYNDACDVNFIEQDGILKVIDNGDSSFIDPLRPGAKGYNFELPNWCGVGLPNLGMLD